jgi:hypothetical protein
LAFERLLFSFSPLDDEAGVFSAVVLSHSAGSMTACQPEFPDCRPIRRQFVCSDGFQVAALISKQLSQQFQRCLNEIGFMLPLRNSAFLAQPEKG